jgi:hypothetical protein
MKKVMLLLSPLLLSACVATTALGVAGTVAGTVAGAAVKTTGAVAGAAVSVVAPHHHDDKNRPS